MLAAQPVGQHPLILCGTSTDKYFVGTATATYTDANLPADWPAMRYGPVVHYRIPVPVGLYIGQLHFVEPNKTGGGQRTMRVTVNNGAASDLIDVYASAGGKDVHYGWLFFAEASTGIVDVQISAVAGTNAIVSGVEILTQEAGITCQQPPGTLEDYQPGFCYPNLRIWFQAGKPFTAQGQ